MKIVKTLDNIVDNIYRIIFILIMLIGLYYVYDTIYVFYNAAGGRELFGFRLNSASVTKLLTKDHIAWLKVDDTSIDYPIMQGETNTKYLNKDPYGDFSLAGSIFLDSRNAKDFSDSYNLLYGHHMANGFMFGALDAYEEKDYWEDHKTGTITLKDGTVYDIEIFACVLTDANVTAIFNPEGSDNLFAVLNPNQFYAQPKNKHIVALSTCLEPGSTRRTVVFATMELGKAKDEKGN